MYDEQGVNKSFTVLSSLHDLYLSLASELTGDALFDKLLESVYEIVNKDYEYNESLTREELQVNIKIVLVDALSDVRFSRSLNSMLYPIT